MNLTILTGNLGKDAISKQIKEKFVIEFTIATTEKYNEKTITDWHNCRYWVKSDKLTGYLKKGTKVSIVGKNKTDSYEKDGQKRYINYVLISELEFLSKADKSKESEQKAPGEGEPLIDNESDLPF